MKIKTLHNDSLLAFQQQFISATGDGFSPNVAIIFASVNLDLQEMILFLDKNKVKVFGCSSCGEFVYDQADQIISDGGLVCALMELSPGTFAINEFSRQELSSFDLGKTVGGWATSVFEKPALLIMASGLDTDGEQLVNGIQHTAGKDITMFGGLAGDDALFQKTFVFTEKGLDSKGAVAMALNTECFEIHGLATSGWVGIGADKIITHAEGNIVYTIDGEPALDFYISYLSVHADELPEIGVEYPLLVKKPGYPDVLRAVINVDRQQRALIFAGSVPNGSIVTFSSSPGFEIIESTRNKINELYQQNKETDLLILFSCMARHNALGPTISEEIVQAWENWKKPLIGFFTYGEIGSNYNAACDFHNETFTMVSIKETHHVA